VPNIKQQEKRMRLAARQTMRNRQIKSSLRTMFKKLEAGVGEGDQKAAEELARHLHSQIDKAAAKHVIHANSAARKKSRVARTLARLSD
jgi:small subunit ribosomal protein S20